MMFDLDIDEICRRIAVARPYFAYTSLARGEAGAVHGRFVREHRLDYEHGPIGIAEIGRNLAILGSCAAAAQAEVSDKVYYLARHAHYTRQVAGTDPEARAFRGSAWVVERGARALTAQTEISVDGGRPFGAMSVHYQVLGEAVFSRIFAELQLQQALPSDPSPYIDPVPLDWEKRPGEDWAAYCSGLEPRLCAGHFPGYPAWPVAILGRCMLQAMEGLLHRRLGARLGYAVAQLDIEALRLLPARAPISFHPAYLDSPGEGLHALDCRAQHDDDTVARMSVVLDTHAVVAPAREEGVASMELQGS